MEITMISVTSLDDLGDQLLFENVGVVFNPGDRYGLTGPTAVSTFMKILSGDLEAMTGHVAGPS